MAAFYELVNLFIPFIIFDLFLGSFILSRISHSSVSADYLSGMQKLF